MTSRTASGKPLRTLALALALLVGGAALAHQASASMTITITIPKVLLLDANLDHAVMTVLGDTYRELEGTLTEEPLRVRVTANLPWSLTLTANGQRHNITGARGAQQEVDLGDLERLNLQPGDHIKLTLAARARL